MLPFWLEGQAKIETQVVQATGGFHHDVIKVFAEVAKSVMNKAKNFDAVFVGIRHRGQTQAGVGFEQAVHFVRENRQFVAAGQGQDIVKFLARRQVAGGVVGEFEHQQR